MPFPHRASATSLATLVLLAAAPAFAGPAQGDECELNEVFRTGGAPSDAILARDHAFIATNIGVEMLSLSVQRPLLAPARTRLSPFSAPRNRGIGPRHRRGPALSRRAPRRPSATPPRMIRATRAPSLSPFRPQRGVVLGVAA